MLPLNAPHSDRSKRPTYTPKLSQTEAIRLKGREVVHESSDAYTESLLAVGREQTAGATGVVMAQLTASLAW